MRKLSFLAAILFMAPITDGMTVSLYDTGTTVELSVFGYSHSDYVNGIAMVIEAPGVLSNFVVGPEGPVLWVMNPVTINGDSGEWMHVIIPVIPHIDGVWLIADFSTPIPVWVSAYTKLEVTSDWIFVNRIQVPEPTTIALLGLGGIFLLRRRR